MAGLTSAASSFQATTGRKDTHSLAKPSQKETSRRQCRTGGELPLAPDVSTVKQGQGIRQWPQLSFQGSALTKRMHVYKTSMCVASADTQHGSGAMNFGKGTLLHSRWQLSGTFLWQTVIVARGQLSIFYSVAEWHCSPSRPVLQHSSEQTPRG